MNAFRFEGSILIDNFTFGDTEVELLKFTGINRVYDGSSFSKASAYNETVSGIIGLAPPQTEQMKSRNFLYQLKEKGVIDYLTFSISMNSENGFENSKVQFGGYDPENIMDGYDLQLIETVNSTTWALSGKDFKIGNGTDTQSFLDTETRFVYFEPSSPFIYAPQADFVKFARELL